MGALRFHTPLDKFLRVIESSRAIAGKGEGDTYKKKRRKTIELEVYH